MCRHGFILLLSPSSKRIPVKNILNLIKAGEYMGHDATGIALINTRENQLLTLIKAPQLPSKFVRRKDVKQAIKTQDWDLLIFHCREATQGSPQDNENNHPFYREDWGILWTHNGMISNDALYREKGDPEVDSYVIGRIYQKHNRSMKSVVKKLSGTLNIQLYDFRKRQLLIFKDNSYELFYMHKYNAIIGVSAFRMIKEAFCNRTLNILGYKFKAMSSPVYEIPLESDTLATIDIEKQCMDFRRIKTRYSGYSSREEKFWWEYGWRPKRKKPEYWWEYDV